MAGAAVPQAIARRAVEWMVELQSPPVADELLREWQLWLASDPDHQRAWQRIEAVNDRLRGLGNGPQHPAVTAALLAPRGSPGRRQAVKALSVAIFTGTLAWTAEQQLPWRTWTADQRTGAGQRRTLALADGTRVALNTGTALNIDYDGSARRLRLLAGEILITTAHEAANRPFLVHTAQGELQALGTRFAVRLRPHATQVSVFDGAVALRPARLLDGMATVLQAGQQALFGSDAVMPALAADEDSVAWTDGFLIAKSLRLATLMAELSRYSDVELGCAPEVAELRVSGSYRLDDIGRVLETLAAALDLEIVTTTRLFGRLRTSIRLIPQG
jgi:transmembrane sensor